MTKISGFIRALTIKQYDMRIFVIFTVIITIYIVAIVRDKGFQDPELSTPVCLQLDFSKSDLVSVECNTIIDSSVADDSSTNIVVFSFGPIPINHASFALLQTVKGVGPKLAQKIIEYREQFGPFTDIDSIQHLTGVGEKRAHYLASQFVFD
ncbi:MAG: competence protein ComEA [Desulforhopalus sp.]